MLDDAQIVISLREDEAAKIHPLKAQILAWPSDHELRFKLASVLSAQGRQGEAAAAMDDGRILYALALARNLGVDIARCRSDPNYAVGAASTLYAENLVTASSVIWGMAITAGRIDAQVLVSYGLALQHQGRVEEAITVFRAAVETFPSAAVHQFLLFPQLFCPDGDARFAREARVWAELYAPEQGPFGHDNPKRDGRRLRVGYVAPNFGGSQLRQFITPLLEHHDPETTSVVLYPASGSTETAWPAWIKLRPIGHLGDREAAALIQEDAIDVLADCWGHTAGSRLGVFARRPAPVQIAWMNFHQSTGLNQIDYVLHAHSDEPSAQADFSEGIWRIGAVFNAFRPAKDRLAPTRTPARLSGQVTFGSFNHPAKLSDPTVAAWARILKGAPNGRLLLKYRYFADPVLQRATLARFEAHGVKAEQVRFEGHSTGADYYASFAKVDLALDTWPAPGSTTTLEALSNGVPLLVLAPQPLTLAGAYSRSIVLASRLPELVCEGVDEFVQKAIGLSSDVDALDRLRARVRPGFENGGYCDEVSFVRRVEREFAEMFDYWKGRSSENLGSA